MPIQATYLHFFVFNYRINQLDATQHIIQRIIQRDIHACKQLYNDYADGMFVVCYRIVGNITDAEDVLQEAFMKVFEKIESFNGSSTLGAWIKRIVINHSLNAVKKRKPYLIEFSEHYDIEDEVMEEEDVINWRIEDIQSAIEQLPQGYKLVFNLYMFEDFSHREIADMLNIAESTAKTQFFKSKKKLREILSYMKGGGKRI